jgi:multiple antibiotic resistance protein
MEQLLGTFTVLFSIVNPFSAMPVFVALTESYSPEQRSEQALKACLYMTGILVVFYFAGNFVLNFFNLRIEDIRIAGGLLIMKSGLSLLSIDAHKGKPISKKVKLEGMQKEDISFTPLAMPLLSGPGAIAVCIGFYGKTVEIFDYVSVIVAIVTVSFISFLILKSSFRLTQLLGKGGMAALTRMMGFITLSIGVSFVLNGILALAERLFP